jgi:SAM-dependent methyltransferase
MQMSADIELLFEVQPAAFHPPPKVDSAVLRFEPHDRATELGIASRPDFLRFVALCFHQKRKTLRNNLSPQYGAAVDVWPEFGRFASAGVETVVLDAARHLRTLGEASFDVVLASNVLEHFSPDTAASVASDVAAVLRPGGRVILIQPNFRLAWRRYFDDYTHRAIFTDVSLPALLTSCGLRTELVEPRFLPYSMRGTALPVRPWLVGAYLRSPIRPLAGQMLVVARKD